MSDHGEILSLVARVAWMVDHEDYGDFQECWTEDGALQHLTVDGHVTERRGPEILEMLKIAYQSPESKCLHIVNNPIVDIDGDDARVRYYVIHTLMGPQARPCGVEECDTLVRKESDGRWRIASMREVQLLAYDRSEERKSG